jgi:glycyl-tRNA synthetase beta chain
MMYGKDVVPATVLDVPAGNTTRGHRFMAPKEIRLTSPSGYEKALKERGKVIARFEERRELIKAQISTASAIAGAGARAVYDDALLDEVTALVEWPVPVQAQFEARFLDLPREVLISTLQDHQRYFPVEDAAGKLTSWFITISNIESLDPAQVRAGNEAAARRASRRPRQGDLPGEARLTGREDQAHSRARERNRSQSSEGRATAGRTEPARRRGACR